MPVGCTIIITCIFRPSGRPTLGELAQYAFMYDIVRWLGLVVHSWEPGVEMYFLRYHNKYMCLCAGALNLLVFEMPQKY